MYESASQSDNARTGAQGLSARVGAVLGSGRAGLVTDVDGTISPIVAWPEQAYVLPVARKALRELRELLSVVAVVSGRTAADTRRMVDVEGLVYIGNHGLEIWGASGPKVVPEAEPWVPRLSAVLADVATHLSEPGVLIENKGATASLHYRLAPDPEEARRTLLEVIDRCAVTSGLRVEEGRMLINLLPPLTVNKGSAVSWLVRDHDLERVVYFGDDVTDAHVFKALAMLRQTAGIQTLGICVVSAETPRSLRRLADATVRSVAAVSELLRVVAKQLKSNHRSGATMDSRAPTVGSG